MTYQAVVLERGRITHSSSSAELLNDSNPLHRLVAVAENARCRARDRYWSIIGSAIGWRAAQVPCRSMRWHRRRTP